LNGDLCLRKKVMLVAVKIALRVQPGYGELGVLLHIKAGAFAHAHNFCF
jgi:hypothetical protein